jgi:hypothetical protein
MLQSWVGIMLLASDERKGLAALLHLLSDHSVDDTTRAALFDTLEDVLKPLVRACVRACVRVCVCVCVRVRA